MNHRNELEKQFTNPSLRNMIEIWGNENWAFALLPAENRFIEHLCAICGVRTIGTPCKLCQATSNLSF